MSYSELILEQCGNGDASQSMAERDNFRTLWRILQMMESGFWRYLVAIIAMSVALSGFDTVTAFLLKDIISRVSQNNSDITGLAQNVFICVIIGCVCQAIYGIGYYVYTMEAKKGGMNLQRLTFSKALRLPFARYENMHSGEFMSKAMYDCERAQGIYGSRFRRIVMPCIMVFCYLVPMIYLNWQVTLCLFGASAAILLVNGMFVRPLQRMSKKLSNIHSSLTTTLSNILSGTEQIKMFGLQENMLSDYKKDNLAFQKGQRKVNLTSACLDGLNQGFELLGSLVFIALGIFFVSIGITTVDNLAAIYVLYGTMSWNLLQVGVYIPSMASYLVNARRVFEFLNQEEEPEKMGEAQQDKPNTLETLQQESQADSSMEEYCVRMENVSFSYDNNVNVLEDFNLQIATGKCVALKGESGKGKSTIAKLLLGFYPITKGHIYLNGKEYGDYKLEDIRSQIGYVPQDAYLYNVSIEENIRYGCPNASKEEIIHAAKMANAHEFIMKKENGYDTIVGERGNRLSGGEKQRIAIARAILKDAPILILDEATSALDNESEQLVNEALGRLMKNRTTIMIAHRESTLERADIIIEI